jgi:cyclic pyranopterin phosphate synthase
VSAVLDGIAAAQAAGFTSIKVNMVVKRGVNEDEIIPLVEHFRNTGIILRFIEFMDVGSTNGWRLDDVVTSREILQTINRRHPLRPIEANYSGEVAKRWSFTDGGGEIGVIASVTQAFCHDCSRIRLSTDGKLYTCLFASDGIDIRDPLRRRESDAMLSRLITDTWARRADRYSQMQNGLAASERPWQKIEMSYIGG